MALTLHHQLSAVRQQTAVADPPLLMLAWLGLFSACCCQLPRANAQPEAIAPRSAEDAIMPVHLGHDMVRWTLSAHPRVYLFDNFLNGSHIEHLLESSRKLGLLWYQPVPSMYSNPDRASNTGNMPEENYLEDATVRLLEERMSSLANVPMDPSAGATIQLAHRNASGEGILDLHHDHNAIAMDILNANLPVHRRPSLTMLVATFIGYLRDTDKGGETVFPCICDRNVKKCVKLQQACTYLYERGVLNVHMNGHNTPFREVDPQERGKIKKVAKSLAKAADNLCKGTSKVGLRVTPRAGRAIQFFSTNVRGVADPRVWHGGCKVTDGVKQTMQRFLHAPQGADELGPHATVNFQWGGPLAPMQTEEL